MKGLLSILLLMWTCQMIAQSPAWPVPGRKYFFDVEKQAYVCPETKDWNPDDHKKDRQYPCLPRDSPSVIRCYYIAPPEPGHKAYVFPQYFRGTLINAHEPPLFIQKDKTKLKSDFWCLVVIDTYIERYRKKQKDTQHKDNIRSNPDTIRRKTESNSRPETPNTEKYPEKQS